MCVCVCIYIYIHIHIHVRLKAANGSKNHRAGRGARGRAPPPVRRTALRQLGAESGLLMEPMHI